MKTLLRIPSVLLSRMRDDLKRPHPFAYERVGFISCRPAIIDGGIGLFAFSYEPVEDENYIQNDSVGAMIGPGAFRRALEIAFNEAQQDISILHVHSHYGSGLPWFSPTDEEESAIFVPNFFHAAPYVPHGALVLSRTHAAGAVWLKEDGSPIPFEGVSAVGAPTQVSFYE